MRMNRSNLCNRVMLGDGADVMQAMPEDFVPLTATSPPYDDMRIYGGQRFDARRMIEGLWHVTRPGGIVAWVVQDQVVDFRCTGTSFKHYRLFREIGFDFVGQIVMNKTGFRTPIRNHYGVPEIGLIFSKGRPDYIHVMRNRPNKTAGAPVKHSVRERDGQLQFVRTGKRIEPFGRKSCVWEYHVGFNHTSRDKIAFDHPALMAEAMAEDLIVAFSRPGDLVFDPMCGAGTTPKMALLNDRQYLGVEIHEPYVRIAEERLRMATELLWSRIECA